VEPRDAVIACLLAVATFLVFATWSAIVYTPLGYLIGDGPYYAATAVSMLHDGDLDLRNQLSGGLVVHGRQIALGSDGAWYPKHPILMPIATLPFLALFGMPGLLVFNLAILAAVAAALFRLARLYAPPAAAATAVMVLILGTFLRAYAYNLSPDLFALLLVTLGLLFLLRGAHGKAGCLLGAALLAKILLAVLLPAAWLHVLIRSGPRRALRFAAGCALPIAALFLYDLALFGSPFVTSYDRNVDIVGGRVVTTSHRSLFDNDVAQGLRGEILDARRGLLPTAPVLLLAIPGFLLLFRRRPGDALFLLGMAGFLIVLLAAYRDWNQSHYGNRFLMPVIACAAPAMALTIEILLERLGAPRRSPAPQGAAEAAP
jgi:4-amino-4-deoxy-L-arabinose transferase-like glycosyltransferase